MKKFIFFMTLLITNTLVFAQQIGIGTENPHATSLLELKSTNKGFLPPRMTTAQRNALISPAEGLTIYNTTTSCLNAWSGSGWVSMCQIVTPDNKINITNTTGTAYSGSIYVFYDLYTFPIATCPLKFNGTTAIKSLILFNNSLLCRGEIPNVSIPAGGNINIEVTSTADTPFLPTETRGRIINTKINMTTASDDASTLLTTTSDLKQANGIITHFVANSLTIEDKFPVW